MCPDAGCMSCVALAGCAWCESSCTCKSATLSGTLTSQQCPTNTLAQLFWTSTFTQCPAAGLSATQCDTATGYRAVAQGRPMGQQQIALDGSQSSNVTLCSDIACSSHGSCVGSGLTAACVCSDGWQGSACGVPPGPCYAATCGSGVCMQQTSTSFVCLCADGSLASICKDSGLTG